MKKDVWYGGKTWKNVWDKTRNYTYLRASGITTLLTLWYGVGTPSNALSRSSVVAPLVLARNYSSNSSPKDPRRCSEMDRKWIGPLVGFVFIRFRRKRKYFIFCLTKPLERHMSSHLTTTTRWPLRSSLAMMEERRPSMWWRASTTTTRAQRPDSDTMAEPETDTEIGNKRLSLSLSLL